MVSAAGSGCIQPCQITSLLSPPVVVFFALFLKKVFFIEFERDKKVEGERQRNTDWGGTEPEHVLCLGIKLATFGAWDDTTN